MKKLVLFDVCKTLVNTNSTKEYICFLDSNNIWNKIYSRILKNRYLSILLYLINKYLNIDLSRELVFSFFKWISISNEDKLSKKFFNQYILKKTKIMDILIKYKKNKSYDIYLVSASINQPIDLLANHLWVWSFSTRLIVENNKYTWHVYHDLLWDKEYALKNSDINMRGYDECFLYTDDISDFSLIKFLKLSTNHLKIFPIINNRINEKKRRKFLSNNKIDYEFIF